MQNKFATVTHMTGTAGTFPNHKTGGGTFLSIAKILGQLFPPKHFMLFLFFTLPNSLGQLFQLLLLPSAATRIWVNRRFRLINRLRTSCAVGLVIAAIGLALIGLSITFHILIEPITYMGVPLENKSKDALLRQIIEARHPSQEREYTMLIRPRTPQWHPSSHRKTLSNAGSIVTELPSIISSRQTASLVLKLSEDAIETQTSATLNKHQEPKQRQTAEISELNSTLSASKENSEPEITGQHSGPFPLQHSSIQTHCAKEFFVTRPFCEWRECQKRENNDDLICKQMRDRYATLPDSFH